MSGKIYYIACTATQRVKIGYTGGQVAKRLRALQTGSPAPLTIIAVESGTQEDERAIHARFADQCVHGEWFEMSEALFEHVCRVVWMQARFSLRRGDPVEDWVRLGLRMMHEAVGPLPDDLAAVAVA